jgi:hypothetical protein
MSGHLECLGFRGLDKASFAARMNSLAEAAIEDAPARMPARHLRWTDASGASIAFHMSNSKTIECVTPFFVPADGPLSRWRVRTAAPAPDPECEHCGGTDCDVLGNAGEMATRAAVQWLHFAPFRGWLERPREFDLDVVAFASQAAFFETSETFREWRREFWVGPGGHEPKTPDGHALRLAEDAFLPSGMFAPEGASMTERATALFCGRVASLSRLTNSVTNEAFHRIRIDSLPGLIDTMLDPTEFASEPLPGTIAVVRAWFVGRPTLPPPVRPTAFWRRPWSKR